MTSLNTCAKLAPTRGVLTNTQPDIHSDAEALPKCQTPQIGCSLSTQLALHDDIVPAFRELSGEALILDDPRGSIAPVVPVQMPVARWV